MARKIVTVDIEGGKELNRKLNALAESMQPEVLEDAALEGAAVFLAEADVLVPRKTGALASTLGANVVASDQDHADVDAGALGSPVAHLVEFGHQLVAGGTLRSGEGHVVGHVPAHPFLRPAYDAQREAMVAAVGEKLKQAIEAAAKS